MKLHDIEKVAMSINQYEANIKQEEKSNRGMSTTLEYSYDKDTGQCTIYHHFFKRKGKCLLAYMYDDILLEVVQIPRIENCKSSKYWAPVILHYEFPDARDPYGWSLWDTMEDDIKLKNLLVNLFKINIVKNVTGDKMFFDAEAFPNLSLLEKQTLYNKYYPVKRTDYTRPIQDLIYRIPEKVIGQDARQLLRECENEAQKQTHIDTLQQGVADASINTAAEAKITQSNANLLQSLTDKIL
ncbi:MAG: hypothetical protein LBG59_02265 [Candidatus Peribacteria bacterium]|jgi:hypothetical protein|nr:hypothetical protein [Candidatus Peribacteria bacterium]